MGWYIFVIGYSYAIKRRCTQQESFALHTTWVDFAHAIRRECGSLWDEAKINFAMTSATRKSKNILKEYCFRMSALGVRYTLYSVQQNSYKRRKLRKNGNTVTTTWGGEFWRIFQETYSHKNATVYRIHRHVNITIDGTIIKTQVYIADDESY